MLGIDDSRNTSLFLHLRHRVDSESGLTGRLRTVDLDDTSFRVTANAQRIVQTQTSGRNNGNVLNTLVSQFHDGTFAIFFVNLRHRSLQCFELVCRWCLFLCHNNSNLDLRCKGTKKKAHTQVCAHFLLKNLQNSRIPHASHFGFRAWHTYRPCSKSQ